MLYQLIRGPMKAAARIFVLCVMLFAGQSNANGVVGSIVPPYPEGWKHRGGACIASSLGANRSCEFSIGILEKSNKLFFHFGKSVPRTDPKQARWLITDQMPYPETTPGFQVVYGLCEKDGKPEDTIIAVVKTTDTEWYTTVHSAYRANLNTGRFEDTSTEGVRCLSEGWGM